MIVEPKVRGFICTTAHPEGCAAHVQEQIDFVKKQAPLNNGPKKVLVIGASTGYGLASRIATAFGAKAQTIGVFFERGAEGKRTGSAGWYNTIAFEKAATAAGLYAKSINGDAFSDAIKQQTIDLIKQDWQGDVDLVVYSLASPRRQHPHSGESFSSVLKPIGKAFHNKTVDMMSGVVSDINIEPATQDEILHTEAVMGGEDWQLWMDALTKAGVLAKSFITLAYSYVGPELTYPIYREGTIGKAKEHLEKVAHEMDAKLKAHGSRALVSVNKALVTQASAAIPVVPLYISLLYKIMKERNLHEGCIEQMWRLFHDFLYTGNAIPLDDHDRIRLDDWEMRAEVQQAVAELWNKVSSENINSISDLEGCRADFYKLFGFGLKGVDYAADVNIEEQVPSIKAASVV
ncbi:MAG TPA: enoyl-ACP reductase FabV [Coxiellaceae bacterium]|nr:enoyl-ACP reductase FabV [Coxiellaceae bacterium]